MYCYYFIGNVYASYTQGQYLGQQVSGTPKNAIALFNEYQYDTNLSLNLGVRYEGERNVGGGSDHTKGLTLPSYVEFDIGARY
ncbi:hypothetical protein [Cognaticolwellia mytili]|uniref:hypothetical protein n=1 Tax=Cognaticolwellia mytili TaxID=1888913 RepID=UPI00117CBAB5|nr:hypothetical protein [Cognaticolwellia mytili]